MFEFNRVVFGKNSAPMESQFVAQENAPRNQDRYPLAAETVLKEARKGFFGCYSVCETMKDTKEGYFIM